MLLACQSHVLVSFEARNIRQMPARSGRCETRVIGMESWIRFYHYQASSPELYSEVREVPQWAVLSAFALCASK
jgi:GDP-D-mannose dehydratase